MPPFVQRGVPNPSALGWSPDGGLLFIGTTDGRLLARVAGQDDDIQISGALPALQTGLMVTAVTPVPAMGAMNFSSPLSPQFTLVPAELPLLNRLLGRGEAARPEPPAVSGLEGIPQELVETTQRLCQREAEEIRGENLIFSLSSKGVTHTAGVMAALPDSRRVLVSGYGTTVAQVVLSDLSMAQCLDFIDDAVERNTRARMEGIAQVWRDDNVAQPEVAELELFRTISPGTEGLGSTVSLAALTSELALAGTEAGRLCLLSCPEDGGSPIILDHLTVVPAALTALVCSGNEVIVGTAGGAIFAVTVADGKLGDKRLLFSCDFGVLQLTRHRDLLGVLLTNGLVHVLQLDGLDTDLVFTREPLNSERPVRAVSFSPRDSVLAVATNLAVVCETIKL